MIKTSRTQGGSPFQKQSVRISESDIFSRQCVGGDGQPDGGNRHLNDARIYGRQFVTPFKLAAIR
jgi:hypothetical protein